MKKILNKLSIWLYKKTKEKPEDILYGSIKIIESDYLPEDTIFIGKSKSSFLKRSLLDKEIASIK